MAATDRAGPRLFRCEGGLKGILLAVALLAWPSLALGQAAKVSIAVRHVGEDQPGADLAFRFRDQVRGSGSFQLVEEDARPAYVVRLMTVELDEEVGPIISYAMVITAHSGVTRDYFVYGVPGYCGTAAVSKCAADLFSRAGIIVERSEREAIRRGVIDGVLKPNLGRK